MGLRSWILVGAVAIGALFPAAAHAQSEMRIAVYAPWSGPRTADARHALALAIEADLEGSGMGPVTVSSFAKLRDFQRALGTADIALVDSGAATSLGRLKIVASWSSGDRWVLASSKKRSNLRTLRLALQAPDAPSSKTTVARLLRGQVTTRYWSKIVGAPVSADARQLVDRGLADVVVVRKSLATGLTELADLGRFSELAIAVADRKTLTAATTRVQDVVRANLGGTWSAGRPSFPKRAGSTKLVTAPPVASNVSMLDLLVALKGAPPQLVIDDLWIVPNVP